MVVWWIFQLAFHFFSLALSFWVFLRDREHFLLFSLLTPVLPSRRYHGTDHEKTVIGLFFYVCLAIEQIFYDTPRIQFEK
jgi:hypothetical protein